MNRRASANRVGGSAQRGQSTVEFVVLGLVLVPLFLAIPLIGKYLDLIQTSEEASRYLAFEGMAKNSSSAWKSDADLALEVRRRFFSNSDAPVKTNDAAGDFAAHRNPIWSDAAGNPLIDKFEDQVGVQTQVASKNAIASALFAGELGLSKDNLYTASVTVKPVNVKNFAPFDDINLSISRKTVLLADAWTARDSAAVRSKIEHATGMVPLQMAHTLLDAVGTVPTLIFDPALKIGEFDWDVVPCDRLVGGC